MKKRGFTLIELLAVIVILAIIALIATPIVMNLIENSRRGAAERTVENIEKAAELYYYENRLDGLFPGITFTCNNENCSSNDKVLQINGKVPEVGSITIDKEGKISLNSIVINGYNCYKENESYKCDKVTKEIASSTNGMLTIDSQTAELLNYRIYGNSIKVGSNLYQSMTFTDGYILSVTGTASQNANYKISDYLEVEPNETYISQMMNNYNASAGTMIRCWSYDKNKNPISLLFENNRFSIGIYENEFKIPENAKYIRISYRNTDTGIGFYKKNPTDGDINVINGVGNYNLEKQKYEITIKVIGKNLFNLNALYIGTGSSGGVGNLVKTNNSFSFEKKITPHSSGIYFDLFLSKGNYKIIGTGRNSHNSTKYGFAILKNGAIVVNNAANGVNFKFTIEEDATYRIIFYGGYSEPVGTITTFTNIQIEKDSASTGYEPYKENNYIITLTEPLRCIDGACDYIDFKCGKVVRNVGVKNDGSLVKLEESTSQDIDLPNININKGISNIFVETSIKPTKVEVEYYK